MAAVVGSKEKTKRRKEEKKREADSGISPQQSKH